MKELKYLENILNSLLSPNQESLKLSMCDVHHKGLFSLVVSGKEHGNLLRVFIANEKLKPYEVQFHTHRYPIKLTTIKGSITHHLASEVNYVNSKVVTLSEFDYTSPLNDGKGLVYLKETGVVIDNFSIPNGSNIFISSNEFHTISCSKGAIWIVKELGFQSKSSKVLGIPFVLDGLYNKPEMFQINDNVQKVIREITSIVNCYKLIEKRT